MIAIALILGLAVGFFGGMEFKAYQVKKALNEVEEKVGEVFLGTNKESEESDGKEGKKETTIIEKKIGDDVVLATLKIKINNIEERDILGGSSEPAVAKEGAKFVVIDAEITNITNDSFDYDSDGIEVVDDKGRRFKDYSDVFFAVDNYLEQRSLQPSISEKGKLVYEIAKDAEHYSLNVKKGGTNEEYKIILK